MALILGIETSCDECSVAIVERGGRILSQVIASQEQVHSRYGGVVPELASRSHIKHIMVVYREAISRAGSITKEDIDGIAVTTRPGLTGSLSVGLAFAKGLSYGLRIPFVGINHLLAHFYAAKLEHDIEYPYIGLLASGGHTMIAVVDDHDRVAVLGSTVDDACGEAFDKVAKHLGLGYPGGGAIDRLAQQGDPRAATFPQPEVRGGENRYALSYSGLKTAVVHQLDTFWHRDYPKTAANIAAAFQQAAIDMIVRRALWASEEYGIDTIVACGGVAANSYLRRSLSEAPAVRAIIPSPELCTDNAAMVAGIGYHILSHLGIEDGFDWSQDVEPWVDSVDVSA